VGTLGGQDDKEKKKGKFGVKDSKRWARQMGRRIGERGK
jgi:hypothetical protein